MGNLRLHLHHAADAIGFAQSLLRSSLATSLVYTSIIMLSHLHCTFLLLAVIIWLLLIKILVDDLSDGGDDGFDVYSSGVYAQIVGGFVAPLIWRI